MQAPINVDWLRQQPAPEVLPNAAVHTSRSLHWRGIEVQRHRQPAWKSPEVCFKQHVISIHDFREPAKSERSFAGKKKAEMLGCGDVVIMPAGVPHADVWDKPGEFTLLIIEPERMAEALTVPAEVFEIEVIPQYAMRDPLICAIGRSLQAEAKSGGPGTPLYAEHLTGALCAHLWRKYSASRRAPALPRGLSRQQLRRAVEFIHDNLENNLSLVQIAGIAHVSPYHFARLFKQAVGVPPHQYVIAQRVRRAQQLLATPGLSVEEVSWRAGFSSQSHFTVQFRKLTGMSPGEYRSAL
jgi:AraC family transcriptional regulator